jgi:hypothetical protein
VGKTADNNAVAGVALSGSGIVKAARTDWSLLLNRLTTDGDIALFQKDGATVGSIGTNSNTIYIDGSAANTGLQFAGSTIAPRDAGALSDAGVDLGNSSYRFKDLYLSGGVYLGGTGAANLLDDYEEGTFTATLTAYPTGPTTAATTTAYYTKTGNIVNVFIRFSDKNTTGASGSMRITGLPFTSRNVTENQAAVPMMHNLTISDKYVTGYISGNSTSIDFINNLSNTVWTATQINATTEVYLNINMTYQVA